MFTEKESNTAVFLQIWKMVKNSYRMLLRVRDCQSSEAIKTLKI